MLIKTPTINHQDTHDYESLKWVSRLDAPNDYRITNREKIRTAIVRLENNKLKIVHSVKRLSLSLVAREAGVDRRTIDLYPKLRERIEKSMTSHKRKEANEKQKIIAMLREKLSSERKVIKQQKALLDQLISKNASLELKLQELQISQTAKNVTTLYGDI